MSRFAMMVSGLLAVVSVACGGASEVSAPAPPGTTVHTPGVVFDDYVTSANGTSLTEGTFPVSNLTLTVSGLASGDRVYVDFSGQVVAHANVGVSLVAMADMPEGDSIIPNGGWGETNNSAHDEAYPITFFSAYTARSSDPIRVYLEASSLGDSSSLNGAVFRVHVER